MQRLDDISGAVQATSSAQCYLPPKIYSENLINTPNVCQIKNTGTSELPSLPLSLREVPSKSGGNNGVYFPKNASEDRRRQQSSFRKRCSTMFRKANELSLMCEVDVYLLTRYRDRFYFYNSKTDQDWLPTEQEHAMSKVIPVHPVSKGKRKRQWKIPAARVWYPDSESEGLITSSAPPVLKPSPPINLLMQKPRSRPREEDEFLKPATD